MARVGRQSFHGRACVAGRLVALPSTCTGLWYVADLATSQYWIDPLDYNALETLLVTGGTQAKWVDSIAHVFNPPHASLGRRHYSFP